MNLCVFALFSISLTSLHAQAFKECATFKEKSLRDRCAPHFICIGTPKAGTRTLRTLLSLHPQIRFAASELDFWNTVRPMADYAAMLPVAFRNETVHIDGAPLGIAVGEKSTWYYGSASAQRMRKELPHVRVLVLLRDPVERSFSQFVENLREQGTRRGKFSRAAHFKQFDVALRDSFFRLAKTRSVCQIEPLWTIKHSNLVTLSQVQACVESALPAPFASELEIKNAIVRRDALLTSCYAQFVEHFQSVFPTMLVVSAEEFYADLAGQLGRISAFLGLAPVDWQRLLAANPSGANEKQGDKQRLLERQGLPAALQRDERALLAAFFRPYNARLEQVLNRRFNWTTA
jgi:hypothetical protein